MFLRSFMLLVMLASSSTMVLGQGLDGHGRSRANQWEFSVDTIYTGSKDISGEGGSSLSFEDNLGWGFGLSYNINASFNVGMQFDWSSTSYTALMVEEDSGDLRRYSNKMDLSTTSITGKWNILKGPFTPYVSGAVGWTLVDTNVFAGYDGGCYWDPWWGYVCGPFPTSYGSNVASYGLGLGARMQLTPKFSISLGYDYKWLDIDAVDGTSMFRMSFGFLH